METQTGTPGFVGREQELATLDALVERLGDGSGPERQTVALVGGDAGIGKTRLIEELVRRHPAARVVTGGCVEVAAALPFAPYVEALDRLVQELGADRVRQLAGPGRAELARILPSLGPSTPGVEDVTGASRLFHTVRTLLHAVAADRPLVVVVEDLHWADPSTIDLTSFLARGRGEPPFLMVATYRSDELHRRHPIRPLLAELSRLPQVHDVALAGLSVTEVARLLSNLAEGPVPLDRVEDIARRSEGNAFYAEELLAAGRDGARLPSALRDLLLLRLDRTGPDTAGVVRCAAVAGRRVPHALLEAVCGSNEASLSGALREAVERGLLVASGDGYAFRHALLREAVYDEVLPGERVRLHRAYAEALVQAPHLSVSRTGVDAELAYHWDCAGEVEAAFEASLAASREAEAAYAYREALTHAERALGLWDGVAGVGRTHTDRLALLQTTIGLCLAAGEIRRGLGHATTGVELAGDDPLPRARFLAAKARCQWILTDTDTGIATSRLAAAALPDEDSEDAASVLAGHARLLALHGEDDEAAEVARSAVAMARTLGDRPIEGRALNSLGIAVAVRDTDEALEHLHRSLDIALDIEVPDDLLRAHVNLSSVLLDMGRTDESIEVAESGIAWLTTRGFDRSIMPFLVLNRLDAMIRSGRVTEAEPELEEVLGTDGSVVELFWRTLRAFTHLHRGRVVEALEERRLIESINSGILDPQFRGPLLEIACLAGFHQGDTEATRAAVQDRPDWGRAGWMGRHALRLLVIAGRAEADGAVRSRDRGDETALSEHVAVIDDYLVEAEAVATANPGDATVAALRSILRAERVRATAPDAAEVAVAWAEARRAYDGSGDPLPDQRLLTCWRHAEALLGADDRDEAAALLAGTHREAVERGFDALAAECEALARRGRIALDGTAGGAGPDDGLDLTPREREVLGLLAQGRTNRQIGEALFISPKTASVHVSHILTKLGAANRSEAGAIAHRLGL